MALALLIARLVFSLVALNSVYSLGELDAHLLPPSSVLPCMKCPPGFSTFCPENGISRCLPCEEGTFSENHSRRGKCRPCSSCHDDEFELRPCTRTSNVICKECSKCAPGFVVLKPCGRTTDTVCEKCPVVKGYMSDVNIGCRENETEDHLVYKKIQEREKPKGSMTIIDVEKPSWLDDKRKTRNQNELAVDENHPNSISSSSGTLSVNPTLSGQFKEKDNDETYQRSLSSKSVVSVSSISSAEVTSNSMSNIGTRTSTDPSLTPTIPPTLETSTKGKHTEPTTKTRFDITPEAEPSDHEMQGDDGNIPRHTTRRSINKNSTRIPVSLKPRGASSVSPSETNMIDFNPRGMGKRQSTRFSRHHNLSTAEVQSAGEMAVPENTHRSKSKSPAWLWGVVVVATGVGAVLAVIGVGIRWKQCRGSKGCFFKCPQPRCRRPRCPASSDCCDGTSVSSVAGVYAEQNHENSVHLGVPGSVTIEHESEDSPPNSNNQTLHTYLPQTVVAEVHHTTPSLFEVFNIRSYITEVEDTFNSSGGKLSAPDSDVIINIDSGAVPEGVNQPFFFRVVYDETSLLRDIPETPDRTLISPVIQCGPENINLRKPVEIIVPHCLYLEEVKKESISVYRCGDGQLKWERVPSASEKNCQSKSWFTVKKDSIHIKTKTFSFWSIFACGGPKRKRATVFANQPNSEFDTICFRFYIYSDSEDSKKVGDVAASRTGIRTCDIHVKSGQQGRSPSKSVRGRVSLKKTMRVRTKERELFPGSKQANEVPFKLYNDSRDITVTLDKLEKGWEMDKTLSTQTFSYDTAYRNGFRSHTSCEFAVKPQAASQAVSVFSCNLKFQQDEHTEHTIYLNPGFTPRQSNRRFSVESRESETPSNSTCGTGARTFTVLREENENINSQDKSFPGSPAKVSDSPNHSLPSLGCDHKRVTQEHCNSICAVTGAKWKKVLRTLGTKEEAIENLEENHTRVEEKCYKGLLEWSRSPLTQKATIKTLCDALRQEGCSEALEALSKEGVNCDACAQIPESSSDLGTCV